MAYFECLPTRLNPLAERPCFSQVHCTDEAHSDHANGAAMHVQHQGEEWLMKTDPGSGQTYYVHRDSKRSQWHAPTDAHP